MSTIKVDTIQTRTGSGNITVSNTIAGNLTGNVTGNITGNLTGNSTVGGTLGVTGKITSTAGITFGSDTATANVLDDYEEGQWTPNVYNHGYSSNWTTKKGDYIKVGKVVHCWFVCDHGNSNSGSGTGNLTIQGMPFTLSAEATSGSTFAHNSTQSVGMWSANPSSQVGNIFCHGNTSTFLLYKGGSNIQSQVTFVTGSFSYIAG